MTSNHLERRATGKHMDILDRIIQPISEKNALGKALKEDPRLDFIDEEMMKVGSLSHGSIEWGKVEELAVELLQTQTKDIKLLSNLLQCLQQDTNLEGVLLSLKVLTVFVNAYWFDAYPVPGEKGKGLRARFYKQIMQRNSKAIKRTAVSSEDKEKITQVLADLEAALSSVELDLALFVSLQLAFKEREAEPLEVLETPALMTGDTADAEKTQLAPQVPSVYFDPKNERATRQSLFSMAGFLNTTDDKADLGYRVRRNALWFSIWQLPSTKQGNITELAAFSQDRYMDYAGLIEKQPSLALLNKIERSIEQSPYWFDGQHLSYLLCQKLGYEKVATAIKQELQSFVERLPEIVNYQAQDGSAFASAKTLQWLEQSPSNAGYSGSGEVYDNWQEQYQKLLQMSEEQGLNQALLHINMQLSKSGSVREQYYWRLLSADLLSQQQLSALAKNEYQVLLNNIKGMSVDDWEPSFSGLLQQSLANIDNSGL